MILQTGIPQTGNIVRVRSHQYLIEGLVPPPGPRDSTLVRLSCLEDAAQDDALEVLWEREIDARLLRDADFCRIASRGFDAPRLFSAYLHTEKAPKAQGQLLSLFESPEAGDDT